MFVKTLMIVVYSRKAAVLFWQTLLALGTGYEFRPWSAVLYEILLKNELIVKLMCLKVL